MSDISTLNRREAAIFNILQDDLSKELFLSRKRHSDRQLPRDYPLDYTVPKAAKFVEDFAYLLRNKKYILYGFGGGAKLFLHYITYYRPSLMTGLTSIWDSSPSKQGNHVGELTITPPTNSHPKNIDLVIITPASPVDCETMKQKCVSMGIDETKILLYMPFLMNYFSDQYFDESIIHFGDHEIFIDGGSFNFSTSLEFLKRCHSAQKIYAFEPDPNMLPFVKYHAAQCGFHNIHIDCAALWSENTSLHFNIDHGATGSSVTNDKSSTLVRAVSLDGIIPLEEQVTFIKLDVEGAELPALKGAAQLIQRHRPKLAVSIYHKSGDYVDIPEWIFGIVPEYHFYIRHHSYHGEETVLYCIPNLDI